MKYYRDGFFPGDPQVHPAPAPSLTPGELPELSDVMIVGSGPAGNLLGAYLAQFTNIRTAIVEKRTGRMTHGQADGIACRTVETFQSFGLAQRMVDEAYWVNETSFWRPNPAQPENIMRTGRIQDVEDGLSEFPHLIMNQARIHDYLLDHMERSATELSPAYGFEFVDLEVDEDQEYPVQVTLRNVENEEIRTVRTKYLVGADGARSQVRKSIGRELHGDAAGHAWGVMDILAVTDFPDIRLKAAIQSADAGSILLIPREGGYLVRLYVDLGDVNESNRSEIRSLTSEQMVEIANRVLHPHTIEVQETVWWSIYEVAQRVTDGFDNSNAPLNSAVAHPHVFIAGDACHTHSAKAGQGMNVSMQDALNLGWKLSTVLNGDAEPALLSTYSTERQPVAQRLIDFDREWSAMMAAGPKDPEHPERGGVDPAELQEYFVQSGRYTAGLGVEYKPSQLTGSTVNQSLATGYPVGQRFHSFPATRISDAKHVELGHTHLADGRFRIYVFAGADESTAVELCNWLEHDPQSPVQAYGMQYQDIDALIDVHGIVQRAHRDVDPTTLPTMLRPRTGSLGLIDQEKAFSAVTRGADLYEARGIDRTAGAVVIVRPDQYVAEVCALNDRERISEYFAGIYR